MNRRLIQARQLEDRAIAAATFVEAQSLRAQADRLRAIPSRWSAGWALLPLIRN